MLRRLLPLALGLALAVGLATPVAAQAQAPSVASQAAAIKAKYPGLHFATDADAVQLGPALAALNPNGVPPPDPSQEYTVAQYKASLIGHRIGPNAYTYNGEFTINGWTASGNRWLRTRTAATCPACTLIGTDGVTPDGLPRWADPANWDWSAIFGNIWDNLWNGCIKGALTGIVGTAGATIAANIAARAAPVYLGPYGYAAFAVSGCVIGIINH